MFMKGSITNKMKKSLQLTLLLLNGEDNTFARGFRSNSNRLKCDKSIFRDALARNYFT